jgi:general secretion pathway protein D
MTLGVFLISGGLGCTAGIEKKEVSEVRQSKEVQSGTPAVGHSNGSNGLRKDLFLPIAAAEEEPQPEQEPSGAEPQETPQAQEAPPAPSSAPTAPPQIVSGGDRVSLNFNHADLVEVVHVLAQHLMLNYTIDPNVKGTVTIHSAEPLKKEDLLPVFHQILRMNSAVAIKSGDLYRIVPIKEGKGLVRPATPARGDSYALQVVPVRFFSVGEMKKLLEPFVTPGGEVLVYPRGNFLIIVDLPSNVQRLIEIKDLIDVHVFSGARMEIYQPKVASAEELAEEMIKIMQAYASSVPQAEGFVAQFIAIPRINQLLVINHSEAAWTYAKRWLERIDVVAEGPGRRIFVYPVENGKATELADILNDVLGQTPVARRERSSTLQEIHRGLPSGTGKPGGSSMTPFGSSSATTQGAQIQGSGAFAVAPARQQAPEQGVPRPARPPRAPTPPRPETGGQEQMRIVPDPATNSLIIFGTAQEFQNIKNILKELDLVPRQVLMEVLVAEISLTDDLEFGVDYAFQRGGIGSTVLPTALERGGAIFGATGLTSVITSGADFRSIITALMEDSKVKVLSHPAILAVDNRPARIQVGSEQPVATGFTTAEVGTTASSTTIQFRNVGRILTIIPDPVPECR